MKLEDLRYEDLGILQIGIRDKTKDTGIMFYVHFHYFINLAYKNSIDSIKYFRNRKY